MPNCMGKLRKVATDRGNFEYYYNTDTKGIESIAKPGSGCRNTCFSSVKYFRWRVMRGDIPKKHLTKFGARLMGGWNNI